MMIFRKKQPDLKQIWKDHRDELLKLYAAEGRHRGGVIGPLRSPAGDNQRDDAKCRCEPFADVQHS